MESSIMEITGYIKVINETKQITEKFAKREFVIVTQEEYPQQIMLEMVQDKCIELDGFKPNDLVKVAFNVRGREWINPEGVAKYFNTLQAWKIVLEARNEPSAIDQRMNDSGEDDDLPF